MNVLLVCVKTRVNALLVCAKTRVLALKAPGKVRDGLRAADSPQQPRPRLSETELGLGLVDGLANPRPFLHTAATPKKGSRATVRLRERAWGNAVGLSFDLLINAVIAGILLGGFYAAVTIGVSISFGLLDIVNIAHPAFIILGSYIAYIVNINFGIDPIVISVAVMPLFYLLGAGIYQIYYESFERYGQESFRGLSFFFGLLLITEAMLIMILGFDFRYV